MSDFWTVVKFALSVAAAAALFGVGLTLMFTADGLITTQAGVGMLLVTYSPSVINEVKDDE